MLTALKQRIANKLIILSEKHFYSILEKELKDCKSVLDVGCGINSPLRRIRKLHYMEGIDLYLPDRKQEIHNKYVKGNVLALEEYYESKSFDAVVLLSVIEHIKKREGYALIKSLEKIAVKKVIIQTPNGFIKQSSDDKNPFQKHISGWSVSNFRRNNYKVIGLRGFKSLREEYALIRQKPWYFWLFVSYLSQFLIKFIPKYAFEILAIKYYP